MYIRRVLHSLVHRARSRSTATVVSYLPVRYSYVILSNKVDNGRLIQDFAAKFWLKRFSRRIHYCENERKNITMDVKVCYFVNERIVFSFLHW